MASPSSPSFDRVSLVITKNKVFTKAILDTINGQVEALEKDEDPSRLWRTDRKFFIELVDPHKYCFVKGVTQVNGLPGKAGKLQSGNYQILPSEIAVDASGSVKFLSYVNNLHPVKYRDLYSSLEMLIAHALPSFESILTGIATPSQLISLKNKQLQVVIGIKNVIIPKDSEEAYSGSSWHKDGLQRENIVASAVFYRNVQNTQDSKLSFRAGFSKDGEMIDLEAVKTETNKMVIFPNIYEHKVEPFVALDKGKEAHRKIITIMLINPFKRIISTADVLPQRQDWLETNNGSNDLGADLTGNSASCQISREDGKKHYRGMIMERDHTDLKGNFVAPGRKRRRISSKLFSNARRD